MKRLYLVSYTLHDNNFIHQVKVMEVTEKAACDLVLNTMRPDWIKTNVRGIQAVSFDNLINKANLIE